MGNGRRDMLLPQVFLILLVQQWGAEAINVYNMVDFRGSARVWLDSAYMGGLATTEADSLGIAKWTSPLSQPVPSGTAGGPVCDGSDTFHSCPAGGVCLSIEDSLGITEREHARPFAIDPREPNSPQNPGGSDNLWVRFEETTPTCALCPPVASALWNRCSVGGKQRLVFHVEFLPFHRPGAPPLDKQAVACLFGGGISYCLGLSADGVVSNKCPTGNAQQAGYNLTLVARSEDKSQEYEQHLGGLVPCKSVVVSVGLDCSSTPCKIYHAINGNQGGTFQPTVFTIEEDLMKLPTFSVSLGAGRASLDTNKNHLYPLSGLIRKFALFGDPDSTQFQTLLLGSPKSERPFDLSDPKPEKEPKGAGTVVAIVAFSVGGLLCCLCCSVALIGAVLIVRQMNRMQVPLPVDSSQPVETEMQPPNPSLKPPLYSTTSGNSTVQLSVSTNQGVGPRRVTVAPTPSQPSQNLSANPSERTHVSERMGVELGSYTLGDKLLGRGAFGEVYLGLSSTGQFVAIKRVPMQGAGKSGEAAEAEAKLLSRLKHPNIVQHLHTQLRNSALYVVMEYCAGGSLRSVLRTFKSLTEQRCVKYTADALAGLKHLHDAQMVHRDIKPENLLLTAEGMLKLSDFGTAAVKDAVGGEAGTATFSTLDFAGTVLYSAPEALEGKFSRKCDVWSIGITVHELITGRLPFPNSVVRGLPFQLMAAVVNFRSPYRKREDGAYELNPDYLKALDKEEEERHGNDQSSGGELPTYRSTLSNLSQEALQFLGRCLTIDVHERPTVDELLSEPFLTKG